MTEDRVPPPSVVIIDYPTAWAFVQETDPSDHHERCSWKMTQGALLCDCDILWNEYDRRRQARDD